MVKSLDEINIEFEAEFSLYTAERQLTASAEFRPVQSQYEPPHESPYELQCESPCESPDEQSYEPRYDQLYERIFTEELPNIYADETITARSEHTGEDTLTENIEKADNSPAPAAAFFSEEIPVSECEKQESVSFAPVVKRSRRRKNSPKRIGNIVFYLVLAIIVTGTVLFRNIAGFTFYTVLTRSMQSEIPQGALVISKKTNPDSIKIGDDITYLREDNSTITHRVVNIIEDYEDTGERGFETRGIENELPDAQIVFAANVIGVVQVAFPDIGVPLYWVAEHIVIILGVLAVLIILFISLRTFFSEIRKEKALAST